MYPREPKQNLPTLIVGLANLLNGLEYEVGAFPSWLGRISGTPFLQSFAACIAIKDVSRCDSLRQRHICAPQFSVRTLADEYGLPKQGETVIVVNDLRLLGEAKRFSKPLNCSGKNLLLVVQLGN